MKALELLDRDLRTETKKLLERRVNFVDCPVVDSIETSIKVALTQIAKAEPCSGLYIWSVEGNAGNLMDGWRKRSNLFARVTAENKSKQIIKTEDETQAVWFDLTPLSYQWQVVTDEVKRMSGGFTLYIGKRSRKNIKDRLRDHCYSSAQTGALKLAGNAMMPSRLDTHDKCKFFEEFKKSDLEIIDGMKISRIVCDVIELNALDGDEVEYLEAILRTALVPMMGRR